MAEPQNTLTIGYTFDGQQGEFTCTVPAFGDEAHAKKALQLHLMEQALNVSTYVIDRKNVR